MAAAILQKDSKQAAASVSAALDIEGNMPLTLVQLDSLVVLKIAKHCRESYPSDVTGQLLGLDVNGILDVTHCFPFPSDDDEEANAQYQLDMMRCLREVNVDNNTVGWYRSANMGNFLDLNLIDTQYNYQHSLSAKSIVIIHDVSKSASQGNLNLRAFRLTDNFMKLYATKKYTTEAFAKAKLSFSTIFEELPLTVHNSYLATALLQELDTPAANQTLPSLASFSKDYESAQVQSILTPNFDILDLELDPFLEKNLDDLLDCSEAQHQEQNNWQYWQRSVGREQAKIQQYLQKKKQENLHRVAQQLEPIPEPTEHELAALFKLPPEPSRLESMVLNAQMHHFCKQLNQFAGPSLGRLFAVQELQK